MLISAVYELSAKFPPPTAPRDFVTLLLTADSALTERSAIQTNGGHSTIPRHWVVVSIPCDHPDAPPRQGFVRGTYESVEIIREIPLSQPKSKSTPDLLNTPRPDISGRPRSSTSGENLKQSSEIDDPELNPVEWIMVTRSDPGGGIPRFLVDRGTPPSIAGDVVKFLDWACARSDSASSETKSGEEETDGHDEGRRPSYSSINSRLVAGIDKSLETTPGLPDESSESMPGHNDGQQRNGIIGQVGNAIGQGLQVLEQQAGRYTPDVIQQQLPTVFPKESEDSDDGSTDSSSLESFASAEPYYTADTSAHDGARDKTPVGSRLGLERAPSSHISGKSQDSTTSDPTKSQSSLSSADKELAKIDAKKRHLDQKLAASKEKREKEAHKAQAKSAEETEKQRTRHERELQKQQDRHDKEIRKLEQRAQKEARKLEARRQKEREKDTLFRMQSERDEVRQRNEVLEEENKILREQMGELQRENTKLVAKMGGMSEHGQNALRQVRDEINEERGMKKRGTSVGSTGSKGSGSLRGRPTEKDLSTGISEPMAGQL